MKTSDAAAHARGESPFLDDLPEPPGLLFGAVVCSPVAHGILEGMDLEDARGLPGVAAILTAADIPGENQIGGILPDEPLLAVDGLHYVGQPVALVLAGSADLARRAAARVTVRHRELPPVLDPRAAAARGEFIAPSRTLALGDPDAAWSRCALIVSGRADSGGQEHVYLETQAAMAVPGERGRMKIHSGTQAPAAVQKICARVLGRAMNAVEVEVARLGGAFGGKEDQATPWAALCALGADRTGRPVKIVLRRHEDMRMTGKRHPYSSDFKIGLDASLKIVAYEVVFYQNAGAAADLSTAVLERSLFHATNSYFIPNARITGHCCRTHLPPFTAFRGFGGPQAMFVIEAAIARAAEAAGVTARAVQEANLLGEGDAFPYGMRVSGCRARRCFAEARARFDVDGLARGIAAFNAAHARVKRGMAVMPVCFGISFTNTLMNQAGALVHIYTDGSVAVNTGAVEMGQGVHAKIRRIVAATLGIGEERVCLEPTGTARVANTSPTAASAGADLNGMAARMACLALRERLRPIEAEDPSRPWNDRIALAYQRRVNLSAQAHYATPGLFFDKAAGRGEPFAYHVFGAAVVTATVDGLRGTVRIDAVRAVHDAGRSLDERIDRGQAEGAIVQGVGWVTMEDLVYDARGRLLTDSLATYKVPDLHAAPELEVVFLEDAGNPRAVMQSKGIGEPPFMYGIGAYFAALDALRAFRPGKPAFFHAPLTHERAFRFLHDLDAGGAAP